MLKKYVIENFKSFKNRTEFDFERTNYQTLVETNVKDNILKGALFVGANASGKSNSIEAIKFLLDNLFGKSDINKNKYSCLFSKKTEVVFEYTFDIDGSEIIYKFMYHRRDDMMKEELYLDSKELLLRDGSIAHVKMLEEVVHEDVPSNSLFLRDIYFNTKFRGWEKLQKWFEFLSNSIYVDLYKQEAETYRDIDLDFDTYIEKQGPEEINNFFTQYNFEQTIEYDKQAKGNIIKIESPEKIVFFRKKGIEEPIPAGLESLGNKLLLELLPSLFYCINNGGMLIMDEFSSGFHNDLEELLVKYFMRNSNNSQIIFVSHSTNLLSNRILRPDQIYSVEFDKDGSKIKRFSKEQPREAQNLEKMYLAGVFDGIPKYESTDK